MSDKKQDLIKMFTAGVDAVSGYSSTLNAVKKMPNFTPDMVISVGKAAAHMAYGALDFYGNLPALVVTKYKHSINQISNKNNIKIIESGHPILDENSLLAGEVMVKAVSQMPKDSKLLLLVSGGASALAESLPDDVSLKTFQSLTDDMIAGGLDIGQINQKRKQISRIKGGKLLSHFCGKQVIVLAISDVEGDEISTIGSGIGDVSQCNALSGVKLIATNKIAREAVKNAATNLGYNVIQNVETLYDNVENLIKPMTNYLKSAKKGVHIWGGEPTVNLPKNPGEGGRNQALALSLAAEIYGKNNISLLVAGTDGSDGPTLAAGGIVDGKTFKDKLAGKQALEQANSGDYLKNNDALFITGPTGTNVMDLAIAIIE